MKKYEHLILDLPDRPGLAKLLDQQGVEGWKLVGPPLPLGQAVVGMLYRFFFRRRVQ